MNQVVLQKDILFCGYNKDMSTDIADQQVAAIYCRLSKEDEDKLREGDDSASIQNQKMLLVDYALEKGFYVHDIYSDDDYTGFDKNRPDFNRMITDAKLKKFNVIICKTQSRFTRDMELVEKYIHGLFPLLGIRFIGVTDNVDTNIKGNKKARQIHGLVNEWYSEDLSENIRRVFKAKMEKGQFLGAFACYGYKKDPADKYHLIIDEEAAAVVRKIFQYVIQGLGAKQICDKLYSEGIPTPYLHKKMQGLNFYNPNISFSVNGFWSVNTVRRMLRNRTYIGDVVQGMEKKISYKSNKKAILPKEEWIIVEGCHEPIIDRTTFDLVQKILNQRKCAVKSNKTGKRNIHMFAGKLRCKDCGSVITRINGVSGKKTYLYCKLFYKSKGQQCSRHSLLLGDLTKTVTCRIKQIINSYLATEGTEELRKMMSLKDDSKKRLHQVSKEISQTELSIEGVTKAITLLYVDKANGKIDEKEYIELKQSMQHEKYLLTKRNDALRKELNDAQNRNNSNSNLDALIHKYANFKELTHEIVNEFIDFIEIGEKDCDNTQEVTIHWCF